jgi:hypothetical protein
LVNGTAVAPGVIMVSVALVAVPKADWRSVTFYAPAVRLGGVAILLAALRGIPFIPAS